MLRRRWLAAVACVACLSVWARGDLREDMEHAAAKLEPVLQGAEEISAVGGIDQLNQKILATFPDKTRTAAESLLLGNILYRQDPKTSYALHQRAVTEFPDDSTALLEWAMEQHRAGEYAAASETYAKIAKAMPEFGPVLGMWAECLIRTGKTKEAVDAWLKSETGHGSLEQLESWVCEVHTHDRPDHDRADLFAKTKAGDIDAAEKLVALDGDFPGDWWNAGPKTAYLEKDLELLNVRRFKATDRLHEIRCAAECGVARDKDGADVTKILGEAGYLIDDHATLPSNGKLAAQMLAAALAKNAISKETARAKFGEAVLAKAKATNDADFFNVAANLYLGTDRLPEIDQLGWDATGQSRFAASLLVGLAAKGNLKLDDPRLTKAVAQFPEDAEIARVVVMLTKQAGKPMQTALVNAIKAEYTHFSTGGGLMSMRPSANGLRAYFSELSKELNVKVAEGGDAELHVRTSHLVGSELRVLVETSRSFRPPFSNSSKTADVKGWLVTVDLSKTGPLADRSRVIGPLWDVPNPRSTISFQAGAIYSQEDIDAANATPIVTFLDDGTLLRLTPLPNRKLARDTLSIDESGASWKFDREFDAIANYIGTPSEDAADTRSGVYHLQRSGFVVRLYEAFTGRQVQDPWLEKAFAQYRDNKDLRNVRTMLTDDLKFLVCNPAEIWNDGTRTLHKTFEVQGKAYSRADYGLVWARGSDQPQPFRKEASDGPPLFNGPDAAISIDGRLYLYYHDKAHLRLLPFDGGNGFETDKPTDPEWEWVLPQTIQHNAKEHQLIFFARDFMTKHRVNEEATITYVWDYLTGKLTRTESRTSELFQKVGTHFVPRKVVEVR